MTKRLFDVAVAGAALVATAPLLVIASVAIKLDSPGPILFRQTRVGRGKQRIRTLKLRTMRDEAERSGPQITSSGDTRITRVGRILRRAKIDELPQLWNVLRGEMSLVGPRPEVPRYVETYEPEWQQLFEVRPGITDLASLTFRDEESLLALASDRDRAYREVIMPMKLALAVEDLRDTSVAHDLRIILRTALAIMRCRSETERAIIEEARVRIEGLERDSKVTN